MKSIFFYALSPQCFPQKYYQYHLIFAQISRRSSNHNNVPRTPYLSNFNTTLHGKIEINYNNNTILTIRYCDFMMIAVGNNLFFSWGRVTFATKLPKDNTKNISYLLVFLRFWCRHELAAHNLRLTALFESDEVIHWSHRNQSRSDSLRSAQPTTSIAKQTWGVTPQRNIDQRRSKNFLF